MTRRGVGLLLVVSVVIGLGALIQDFRFDSKIATERAAALALERQAALNAEVGITTDSTALDRVAIDRNIQRLANLRLATNGIALVFLLAVTTYLGRAAMVLSARPTPTTAQLFRELPPPVKPGATPPSGSPTLYPPVAPPTHAVPAALRPASLAAAAELCADLAKVVDPDDLPALLERAAPVLDARGIVLWVVDADGVRLRPALTHGYSDRVVSKLQPVQLDADNVTALAYRSTEAQALNGTSVNDPAAIAIPMVTSSGCVGVLAAELRHNRPHADSLPVGRILAAQFSTLIAPPETDSKRRRA